MKNLSFRIPPELAKRVAERARPWPAQSDSEIYRQVIDEWDRLQEHPGIRYVDGPAGRRAALVGGPDVWEVVDTLRAYESNRERMLGDYPWLSAEMLEIAIRYGDSFPEEIDAFIDSNVRAAEALREELDLVVREGSTSDPPAVEPGSDS